ncbi:MAG: ATP-binding protein [Rectinema sp.]
MTVTIMSGKGGVGKTTVAVSFATQLARRGEKVLLADLDVEEPNAGLFLQKQRKDSIDAVVYRPKWREDLCIFCGKCQGFCKFNAIAALPKYVIVFPELCHSCYACSDLCPASALPMVPARIGQIQQYSVNENLVFIEGYLDIGQEIASTLVRQTRDKALREAQAAGIQWLVFDAAPGTACASREAMIKSDAVILVTEPTPFGLHDMSLAFWLVKASGKPCAIVINKDSPGYAGIEKFANEEKVPIIARIPYNSRLAQSYSEGNIPVGAFPALEHALSRIASWLLKVRAGGQP